MESPEHLVVYRGKIRLDADGKAVVRMPDYFGALTREDEASIHLTPSGSSPFMMSGEWNADFSGFTIHGDPDRAAFWEVLAERDDPVIRGLKRPVEEDKGSHHTICDRGEMLNPAAYGFPGSIGRHYDLHQEEDPAYGEQEHVRYTE